MGLSRQGNCATSARMENARFLGFGSLVNTRTHDYPGARRASVLGWSRIWVQTPDRAVTFLSACAAPDTTIEGLVCDVPNGDWAALDAREAEYTRQIVQTSPGAAEVALYTTPGRVAASDITKPILLSYVDVVAQGFEHWYGAAGVTRFFDTTMGWQVLVLDDRAAPRYPRHQTLAPETTAQVDAHLHRLGVDIIRA